MDDGGNITSVSEEKVVAQDWHPDLRLEIASTSGSRKEITRGINRAKGTGTMAVRHMVRCSQFQSK